MPTINRIDEFNPDYDVQAQLAEALKNRRQPLARAARGIAAMPTLAMADASHVPQAKPPTLGIGTYMKEAPAPGIPQAALAAARPGPAAPPSNFGMNNRSEDYVTPRPEAKSIDAATMQQPTTAAPAAAPVAAAPASIATLDPQTALALRTAQLGAVARGESLEPGYRGPQAPGRSIAGDFDFATNAAADFAARTGNTRQAKGIGEYISARDAAARGDTQMKSYADNSLTQAQAGESQQRGILTGVQAADMQATRPGRVAGITAGIDQTKAQTAESAQRTAGAQAMLPGQVAAQGQTTELQGIQLKQAKELDTLRTKALAGDPKAVEQFRQYMRDQAGKGGNITDEDIVKHWSELVVAHNKAYAGQQDAPPVMSLAEFRSQIAGKQLPMEQNPRALAIQAAVKSGTLKREDGMRQLAALGYSQ